MERLPWAVPFGVGIVLEIIALRHQRKAPQRKSIPTLSDTTRWAFHTDTPVGRLAFSAFWVGLGVWFYRHILKPIVKELS